MALWGAIESDGQRSGERFKAAEDSRTPKPSDAVCTGVIACVLECGCPLPLWVWFR